MDFLNLGWLYSTYSTVKVLLYLHRKRGSSKLLIGSNRMSVKAVALGSYLSSLGWLYSTIKTHSTAKSWSNEMSGNDTVTCDFLPVHLHQTRGAFVANIITAVLNSLFSVTAVCGNAFIIIVIWRREVLHVPSNLLLCCLAISDLVVGLISQPAFVIYKVTEIKGYFNVYCAARMLQFCSGWFFSGVSLFTLCAISVDRYLALKLHLRYTAVVTATRVLAAVFSFWLLCVTNIGLRFVMRNDNHWDIISIVFLFTSLFVTVVAYANVFQIVHRHRRQIHEQFKLTAHFHGLSAVEIARHEKSAVTMLYVLGAFLLCYVPLLGTVIAETVQGYTLSVKFAYDYTTTVVFLSSSLNPLLYCWRIREIRRAAKKAIQSIRNAVRTIWR